MTNPLLSNQGIPDFPAIQASHVLPAVEDLIETVDKKIAYIEQNAAPTWNELVEPLEEISLLFQRQFYPVSHLLSVRNTDDMREAFEAAQPKIIELGLRLQQSEAIYRKMKQLRAGDEWTSLDHAQQRIVDKSIEEAELSGIALTGEARERFNTIARELSQLSTKFSNNVLDATKSFELVIQDKTRLSGLPDSYLAHAAQSYNASKKPTTPATQKTGPWRITLDLPSYEPVMKYATDRGLREELYRAFIRRASDGSFDNSEIITQLLSLRHEMASLLGFESYAAMSASRKMARNVGAIETLLEELRDASLESARKELTSLKSFAASKGHSDELQHWDIAFWAEKQREELFKYNENELKKYFPLPTVLDGLFALVNRLFGVTVKAANGEAPVWDEAVQYFNVLDENENVIAAFFLDPYSRPENKRGGAWMNECVVRHRQREAVVRPVAYLVCNFTPPIDGQPSLLTFREVETLFHEFGHGLQHMLTRVDYLSASGINGVEWDAVELPSQFMENWCYHPDTLRDISRHIETKDQLPQEMVKKLQDAKNFMAATGMLRQLLFGLIDIELHHRYDAKGSESVFDRFLEVSKSVSVIPQLPEKRFLCSFSHIFAGGYAAGYYSYKWAEVLSADAFSAFEEVGLDDQQAIRSVGRKFRDTVLALGGSKHPMEVFVAFRGREPSTTPLLKHQGLLAQ